MILDEIFQGEFSVEHFSYPKNPEYKILAKNIEKLVIQAKEIMGAENSKIIDNLLDEVYASQYMEAEACFKAGFATGVQLQREITEELQLITKHEK